ncbi:MAG: hypothetical protein IH889_09445 [Planctomycetes bacterium]|nr:hypothetical protein [Planctomycetota bacterium]
MRLRKTFLWSMIVSLSLTAVLGIAALLLPGFRRWSEEILVSSLLVGGFSLGCLICAIVLGKRRLVPAMWVGIVAALCALAVWLILTWWTVIVGPGGPWVQGHWVQPWGSLRRVLEKLGSQFTTVIGWALIVGLLVLPRLHGRGPQGARALAFVLTTLLALFTSSVAWFHFDNWWMFRLFSTFVILFGLNLWAAVLLQVRLDRVRYVRVRLITICIGAALVAWSLALIWDPVLGYGGAWQDWWERMTGVLAILTSCGTIVTPILALIEKLQRKASVESLPMKVWVTLTCPRCKTQQQMRTGPVKCASCGLRITIAVEEPRCACGYLLYRLESNRCPECGREIAEADRWAAT